MRKNRFAAMSLAILLTSLALPMLAHPVIAQPTQVTTEEEDAWKMLQNDAITVLFPADGRKPMFLWWYNEEKERIYVVKFQGLIEYFTFDRPYYQRRYQAVAEHVRERFLNVKWMMMREETREGIAHIFENWHSPYLPFRFCEWTLTDVENGQITAPDGTTAIGVTFSFNLVEAYLPRFDWLEEDSITVRCRLYNVPVTETSGDLTYEVSKGEMKMDFSVKNWKWNIDTVRPLLSALREEYDIEIPERESKLALWINLASINIEKMEVMKSEPEEIESASTATYMLVDGDRVSVEPDNSETEDEKPIPVKKSLREHFRLQFAEEDDKLAGFFKFVASAEVDGEEKPVTASYIEAGAHMRLFICYPYFEETLTHDPSIGVEVPDKITPQYTVEVPSGTEIVPRVVGGVGPTFITPELVVALVVVVSIIAIAVFVAKRKGKIVNVVGVK